jgi:hypothetical protein
VSCDPGTTIVTGGWSQVGGATTSGGDRPLDDTTWEFLLGNLGPTPSYVTLYAVCIR